MSGATSVVSPSDARIDARHDKANVVPTKMKPLEPASDYPPLAHNNGQWATKINEKLHHFGP
jgi:hypothetical protein